MRRHFGARGMFGGASRCENTLELRELVALRVRINAPVESKQYSKGIPRTPRNTREILTISVLEQHHENS
jgi:hypothetical protein